MPWARLKFFGFAFAENMAPNPKHEIRSSKQYKMTKILNMRSKDANIWWQVQI